MSRIHEHATDRPRRQPADVDAEIAPGKQTLTEHLAVPRPVLTSGLIQRKARDDNGVAADADQSLARAATSSGAPLPAPLRERFESSLGADLSSVRIHTGADSATAARAVHAKAYTVGSDIHFGAGHYDPSSARGQHLLAHEVAHTVQQAGAAPTRQHKLEVSTPHDAAEHDADRAADAMLAGAPARVSAAPTAIARDIADSEWIRENQETALANAENQRKDEHGRIVSPPSVLTGLTVTADLSRCDEIVGRIDDARGNLGQLKGAEDAINADHKGLHGQDFKDYIPQARARRAIDANTATRKGLDATRQSLQKQDFNHGFFEPAYVELSKDFLRLRTAAEIIKVNDIDVGGAGAEVDKARANPVVNAKLAQLGAKMDVLRLLGGNIPKAVTSAEATFRDVCLKIDQGRIPLPTLQDSSKQSEANAKVKAINDDLAAAKATISKIQSTVSTAMTLYGGPAVTAALSGMAEKAKERAGQELDKLVIADDAGAIKTAAGAGKDAGADSLKDGIAESMTNYQSRIAHASGEQAALKAQVSEIQIALDARELLNLQATLGEKTAAVFQAMDEFNKMKEQLVTLVKDIETELKAMGGSASKEVSAAIQLATDVERFDAQADVTLALGDKEQGHARDAEKGRTAVGGAYGAGAGADPFSQDTEIAASTGGKKFWTCDVSRAASAGDVDDLSGFMLEEHTVIFNVLESDKHQRGQPMADAVQSRLDEVRTWKKEAAAFKVRINRVLKL